MKDQTAQMQPQPQNFIQKIKTNKRYLFLLLGIALIFILGTIIYIGSKEGELPPPGPQPTPLAPRADDKIIIKFKPEVSESTINETLKKYNAISVKRIDAIQRIVIQVPKGQADAIREQMKKDNLIEDAEPDYINQADFSPNDTSFNLQYGLDNTGQTVKGQQGTPGADVNAKKAWDITKGSGIKIAVLDTGIDINHPDLSSKVIAQKDFTGLGTSDGYGHGTHVAGIVAAVTNNSSGIAGTCPDCQLLIGKVLNNEGSGPDSIIIQGITWAADNDAKVINMSFGGGSNTKAKQDAINYAWNKGAVLLAAAGNKSSSTKHYPSAAENVVAVAATDNKDQKASFSNYGSWVDVTAPGNAIYSTLPTYPFNLQKKKAGLKTNYDYLNGTSMSTPIVSGVAGLIWQSSYGTSNSAVVQRLFDTADKISGTGQYWTYGRVNAGVAVSGASDAPPTTPTAPPPSVTQPTDTPIPTSQPVTVIPSTTPTTTPSITLTGAPSLALGYPTPTLYCLGPGCPTLPPTPSTEFPSLQPSISEIPLSEYPIPSYMAPSEIPSIALPSGIQPPAPGEIKGILDLILDLFKKIIEMILKLLGLPATNP